MSLPQTIAIDGPAASGKSTLALRLSQHLDYLFFDTGVMYRAITWAGLQRQLALSDEAAITRLAEQVQIDVRPASVADGRSSDILIDGLDVTWKIRDPQVDAQVSVVAAYPGVRRALTLQQRRVGQRGRVVMVGRDIGTVVLPDADLKIYLDASVEQRALRRHTELAARGQTADYAEILESMRQRDYIDSNRKVAPLRPAEDALILDSDHLDADQVLAVVKDWVSQGSGKLPALKARIDLITLVVDDLPAMLRFYRDVLGLICKQEAEGYVEFEHPGVRFSLCTRSTFQVLTRHASYQAAHTGQACELAFPVDTPAEVDRVYLELLARGAAPVFPPATMPWGHRTAFFADPEGNIHELFFAA